jgi:hypothetical protein
MWGEVVGQVFTGAAAIVTAVGGVMLARSRQMAADLASCRSEQASCAAQQRMWRITALRHIHTLERLLGQTTMSVPERPDELL